MEEINKKQGFMKKKIIYSVVIVLISIVASFFYASVWTGEEATISTKWFLTGVVGFFHLVFMFVGDGIANYYND